MKRKKITAKGITSVGPYSQAIEVDGFVYLSGQTPLDQTTGKLVEGDIKAQTQQVFKNLWSVLESAGLTSDNVIKVNVFLTDMKLFSEMNDVYKTEFTEPYPARSTVGVKELPLGASIEIELIAKRSC